MAIREIILYSNQQKALRKKSREVPFVNRKVMKLIQDLKDTLNAHSDGIGLAAPQINIHKRLVVVCLGAEVDGEWQSGPMTALVNPKIIEAGDERVDFDGCLSFPGLFGETTRPHHIHVTGLDERGNPLDQVFDGFNAVVVHHEIDHLEGILFIDRIENPQDLYTLHMDENENMVREPVSPEQFRHSPDHVRFA
jgi:peptide deformylase